VLYIEAEVGACVRGLPDQVEFRMSLVRTRFFFPLIHGPWYSGYYPDTSGLRAILCEPFNKIIPHMQLLACHILLLPE
jgi:hypothetical protein